MKKIGFFAVPVIMILMLGIAMPKIMSSGMNRSTMIIAVSVMMLIMFLIRPKKAATKSADAVAQEILNDFCQDAFSDNEALKAKFNAALNDIGSNCPKSAVSRLEKLAAQCTGNKEKYAVAMATALAYRNQQNYKDAVREYNKAVVLHPSAALSAKIGDCHQRLGNLSKARDSFEFATELEPANPQYFANLATVHVADGDYETALDTAMDALELDEKHASALATAAICYGMKDDSLMQQHYTRLAVENGYSEEKIRETVKALKKRK